MVGVGFVFSDIGLKCQNLVFFFKVKNGVLHVKLTTNSDIVECFFFGFHNYRICGI